MCVCVFQLLVFFLSKSHIKAVTCHSAEDSYCITSDTICDWQLTSVSILGIINLSRTDSHLCCTALQKIQNSFNETNWKRQTQITFIGQHVSADLLCWPWASTLFPVQGPNTEMMCARRSHASRPHAFFRSCVENVSVQCVPDNKWKQ